MDRLPLSAWKLTEEDLPWLRRTALHGCASMCWTVSRAAR